MYFSPATWVFHPKNHKCFPLCIVVVQEKSTCFHLHESETSGNFFSKYRFWTTVDPLFLYLHILLSHCIQDASYKSRRKSAGHSFVHMQQAQIPLRFGWCVSDWSQICNWIELSACSRKINRFCLEILLVIKYIPSPYWFDTEISVNLCLRIKTNFAFAHLHPFRYPVHMSHFKVKCFEIIYPSPASSICHFCSRTSENSYCWTLCSVFIRCIFYIDILTRFSVEYNNFCQPLRLCPPCHDESTTSCGFPLFTS